jgi:PEP-CTERM motif
VLGTLTLNFVPEPGTLLLLGSGVAGLAILGRRRMGR